MTRLLLTVLFLETGLVLLFVPWSTFWDRNVFAQSVPAFHALLINDFVRGAVSGVGVLNVAAGVAELYGFVAGRRRPEPVTSITQTTVVEE